MSSPCKNIKKWQQSCRGGHIYEFCVENIAGVNWEISTNAAVQDGLFQCLDCSLEGGCCQWARETFAFFLYLRSSPPCCSFPHPLHTVLVLPEHLLGFILCSRVAVGNNLKNTSWAFLGHLPLHCKPSVFILCYSVVTPDEDTIESQNSLG